MCGLRHIEHVAYNYLRSGITHTKVRDGERGLSKNKTPHNGGQRPAHGNLMGEDQ
jgi:hypothetical protein